MTFLSGMTAAACGDQVQLSFLPGAVQWGLPVTSWVRRRALGTQIIRYRALDGSGQCLTTREDLVSTAARAFHTRTLAAARRPR